MPDEIAPTFRSMPESVAGRWKLIRRFTESWRGVVLGTGADVEVPPVPPNDVAPEFPLSFLSWLRFCHALELANCWLFRGDNVVTEAIPGRDAVSLVFGGEGDCYWGVLYSDLQLDDPPVHKFVLQTDSGHEVFLDAGMESESITEFALLRLAFRVFPRSWIPSAPATESRIERMRAEFKCHARLGGLWVFESPSVAAFVERDGTLIIGMKKSPQESDVPASVAEVLW